MHSLPTSLFRICLIRSFLRRLDIPPRGRHKNKEKREIGVARAEGRGRSRSIPGFETCVIKGYTFSSACNRGSKICEEDVREDVSRALKRGPPGRPTAEAVARPMPTAEKFAVDERVRGKICLIRSYLSKACVDVARRVNPSTYLPPPR